MENERLATQPVPKLLLSLAAPAICAQIVTLLYNLVDRIYIGRMEDGTLAMAAVGICAPIVTVVSAFTGLLGRGGSPLAAIRMGEGNRRAAERYLGNSVSMLVLSSLLIMGVTLALQDPLLTLFGASENTLGYAREYLTTYILGTVFVQMTVGMNYYITTQGFAKTAMVTTMLGGVLNIALDPVFIFALGMGVRGAALATVLSQLVSAVWAVGFLCSGRSLLRLERRWLRLRLDTVKQVVALGFSSFIMSVTNSAVQSVCNATLQGYGGDLYVGVMTVINSVREVVQTAVNGLTNAAQPVMSFNYGAREYRRVRRGIIFTTAVCIVYTVTVWALLFFFPRAFIVIFNDDPALVAACVPAMHIYFFGFFMMSLQMAGQSVAVALGRSKQAIFFSLLRKAFIVIPLTLVLPRLFGLGVDGVFLAEPISNFVGGAACYLVMLFTIWRELVRREKELAPAR